MNYCGKLSCLGRSVFPTVSLRDGPSLSYEPGEVILDMDGMIQHNSGHDGYLQLIYTKSSCI